MLTLQANIYVYMKFIKYAVSLLNKAYQPIKDNASFFFLHVPYRYISIICGVANQQPPMLLLYSNLWLELFLDLLCYLHHSYTIPSKDSPMDSCFFVYHRLLHESYRPLLLGKVPINVDPSMLLLVGETDEREASEFFSSYFTQTLSSQV